MKRPLQLDAVSTLIKPYSSIARPKMLAFFPNLLLISSYHNGAYCRTLWPVIFSKLGGFRQLIVAINLAFEEFKGFIDC